MMRRLEGRATGDSGASGHPSRPAFGGLLRMRCSRRALRALLTMRSSRRGPGAFMAALLARVASCDRPRPRARRARDRARCRAYRLTPAYLQGSAAERAGLEAELAPIPGADPDAVELGHDLDGDGDADEIHIHLEVIEIQEQVYPGEYVTFWVFAPLGSADGVAGAAAEPDHPGRGGRRRLRHAAQHALPAAHHPFPRDWRRTTSWTACRT